LIILVFEEGVLEVFNFKLDKFNIIIEKIQFNVLAKVVFDYYCWAISGKTNRKGVILLIYIYSL